MSLKIGCWRSRIHTDFNTAVTANLTLTARWTEGSTVTVTFNLGYEGSPAAIVETILQGTAVAAPADPAREVLF